MSADCLPQPHALTWEEYMWSIVPLLIMALMCCLQVYSNRLRRVIAAFYFPKVRELRTYVSDIVIYIYITLLSSQMKTNTFNQNYI